MKSLILLFIVLNSFNLFFSEKLDYQIVFEYLYSDEKDIFDLELYNRPKTNSLDFGDDIFYSGTIEKIENFPVSKLVNFSKEDFYKNNKKEEKGKIKKEEKQMQIEEKKIKKEKKKNLGKIKEDNYEEKKETIKENEKKNKKDNYEEKKGTIKENESKNKDYSKNDLDIFDNIFFDEALIRSIFDNDFNNYIKFIYNKYLQNQKKYEENKNQQTSQYKSQKPYVQIIYPKNNNQNSPIIRIIKYPNNDRYKTTSLSNNEYNPYEFYDENNNDDFDMFKLIEAELNNMYGIRFLSEQENQEKNISKQKIYLPDKHNIVYLSNKLYFEYIKYLPKSTILLTQRQLAKDLKNYEDYYVFTINDGISFSASLTKSEDNFYKVKIGQNFKDSTLILISLSISVFICILGTVIYCFLLRRYNEGDILPVQNLISKFPQYLCLLNILMYFCYISSYNESDGYFLIIKFMCLFLYSLFKSIFICILMLLLSGWMTLTFIGWAKKLNRAIPIIFFEIFTSIFFEIINFYDLIPYNKMQLYYFRNMSENLIIISLALYSINKYYIPLNNKCKYLSLINSDFNDAYNLKKKKMISFSIFAIFYGIISLCTDYFEFDFINQYLQNNTLHVIREMIFISVFNFILLIILLPKELPYLFLEETDLVKCEYLLTDLKKDSILDINNGEIKNIKKQIENNEKVEFILVNPFFGNKNLNEEFDELHLGNTSLAN